MTRLPGPVDRRGGHHGGCHYNRSRSRRRWRDNACDGTHDSGHQTESTRVVRRMMGTRRRRWRRTVVSTVMMSSHVVGRCRAVSSVMMSSHVVGRCRAVSSVTSGSRMGVGCCRDCESAHEGDEKFLVVHITPDFLFLRFCRRPSPAYIRQGVLVQRI